MWSCEHFVQKKIEYSKRTKERLMDAKIVEHSQKQWFIYTFNFQTESNYRHQDIYQNRDHNINIESTKNFKSKRVPKCRYKQNHVRVYSHMIVPTRPNECNETKRREDMRCDTIRYSQHKMYIYWKQQRYMYTKTTELCIYIRGGSNDSDFHMHTKAYTYMRMIGSNEWR